MSVSHSPCSDVSPEAAAELIRKRRTIHLFERERPPDAVIHRAIELARWAPNHRLTEPWRFYLLGPRTAAEIAELNARIVTEKRGEQAGLAKRERWLAVPGWLLVTCRRSDDPIREQEDYAACCCAIQNMMLYLWSEQIGVKWTTGDVTRHPLFWKILNIDQNEEKLVGLFWYGYPAEIPGTPRQPVENILSTRP